MTTFHQVLTLLRELREVRLAGGRPDGDGGEPALAERERIAYERGRRDGERALHEQLLRQRNELLTIERGVLESLRQVLPQVAGDCERAMAELCVELARKLVADMPISVELVERVVQEALSQIQEAAEYHIYLNPADVDLLQQCQSKLVDEKTQDQPWHFHRDPEIARGGCLVKTRFGIIDARRETKVELVKKALLT